MGQRGGGRGRRLGGEEEGEARGRRGGREKGFLCSTNRAWKREPLVLLPTLIKGKLNVLSA